MNPESFEGTTQRETYLPENTSELLFNTSCQFLNNTYPQDDNSSNGIFKRFRRNKETKTLVFDTGINHDSIISEAEKIASGSSEYALPNRIILSGTRKPDGSFSKIRIQSGRTETYFQGIFKREYNITLIKDVESKLIGNINDNTGTFTLNEYANSDPNFKFKQLIETFTLVRLKQSQKASEKRELLKNGL